MKYLVLALAIFLTLPIIGQNETTALRITESINLDGKLNEACWANAQIATDFINWDPVAGEKPEHKTEVRVVYDDNAIYFGAYMQTNSREEIKTELTERDNVGNTDWFGIVLDTYGNGTEASEFIICATGVQFDAKVTPNIGEDTDWSEVWYSETVLTENGWYAEIRIPYSALRFPKSKEQNWRVNFMRRMAGNGQRCSFEYIDPKVSGFINQTAFLRGVSDIKSPLRLSLSPYVTGYLQHNHDPSTDPSTSKGYSYNGGLDLKYGINEAFTLDMTLIPDFGQVQSDNQVLNLSPFEVRFAENRAFFTEGLDLFNKANLFYSRRVGGTPLGYWNVTDEHDENTIVKNPGETQLYNATKLSGRTSSGLGVGVFNAVAGSTHAEIKTAEIDDPYQVETSPVTNYNIVVLDQNMANNSSISLINTNVWRKGSDFYNANVTGTEFNLRSPGQNWGLEGDFSLSQLIYKEQDNVEGIRYNAEFGKISGNWRYDISTSGVSNNYDNNDLGFNTISNIKDHSFSTQYNKNDGWKGIANGSVWFNVFSRTTFDSNEFSFVHFNAGLWARTKGLWGLNMWTNYRPESKDFFEPRVEGQYLRRPGSYNMGWSINSDNRKKLRVGAYVFGMKQFEKGANIFEFGIDPRYRFSDKFSLFIDIGFNQFNGQRGFADIVDDASIIGKRDQVVISNVAGATYTFNSTMSINFRARHYWSKVKYNEYFGLDNNGNLTPSDYNERINYSFTQFNIDTNFTWRFAPGSDIIIVWKNWIYGSEDDEMLDFGDRNYFNSVNNLGELPQQNSLSLRLVYFLNGASFL